MRVTPNAVNMRVTPITRFTVTGSPMVRSRTAALMGSR
jgi:hypothetical protein